MGVLEDEGNNKQKIGYFCFGFVSISLLNNFIFVYHVLQSLNIGVFDEAEDEENVDIEDDDVPIEVVEGFKSIDRAGLVSTVDKTLDRALRNVVEEAGYVIDNCEWEHHKHDTVADIKCFGYEST